VKYGFSSLTSRLLGPAITGEAGTNVELPWSCAIYSIVNWMVTFGDVEGIQVRFYNVTELVLYFFILVLMIYQNCVTFR
jgi:hypothetical protein